MFLLQSISLYKDMQAKEGGMRYFKSILHLIDVPDESSCPNRSNYGEIRVNF